MQIFSFSDSDWKFRNEINKNWMPATVPSCVYSSLIDGGHLNDPFYSNQELDCASIDEREWEFSSEFQIRSEFLEYDHVELVADGLDTLATITLNGHCVGNSENMFVGKRWEVRDKLCPGSNRIDIRFASATEYIKHNRVDFTPVREFCDPVGNAVRIRKQPSQFGWDWAPRLVTAGIWRDLRLEAWSKNTIRGVQMIQSHSDGRVRLKVSPELAVDDPSVIYRVECCLGDSMVGDVNGLRDQLEFDIDSPSLWWPSGLGAQPLYDVKVSAETQDGRELGSVRKRIGLRTLVLERKADEWGESFQFVVNGVKIFAKGANWVPAHSFVSKLTRFDYERCLRAAKDVNMNCIRVWGGGIYESEDFYDLCDELGLMVWQDFMFACAIYPSDKAFLDSVREEAVYQVNRLRHRACLALWCGNNEIAQLNMAHLIENEESMKGYLKIFHELIPEVLESYDPATSYWPSSEWRGEFKSGHELGERSGDTHFWDVWHARHPVEDYQKWAFRFCSEFGMQSYASPETNNTFCPQDDRNLLGPSMEHHQKNSLGNQVILHYVSTRYRYPKNQDSLIYLSQLNQAHCIKVGVQHFRRLMPRCMGALYWQLNDCWPGTSWSSIEFGGRWKALHYEARRFFAPLLLTIRLEGAETVAIGNYRKNTIRNVSISTVCDAPIAQEGRIVWTLFHFDGTCIRNGDLWVRLGYGESVERCILDFSEEIKAFSRDDIYVRADLWVDGKIESEASEFLSPPRFCNLRNHPIEYDLMAYTPGSAMIRLVSDVFHHAVCVELRAIEHQVSDNFFDLHSDREKVIEFVFAPDLTEDRFLKAFVISSLVDSYDS